MEKDNAKNGFEGKIPKLPPGSYAGTMANFLQKIKYMHPAVQVRLIKKFKQYRKANESSWKKKEDGTLRERGKLNEYQKLEILEMAYRLFTPTQIFKVIKEEWKVNVSKESLSSILRKNKNMIMDKRQKYLNNVDGLRLVHERPRIEELTEIFNEAKQSGEKKIQLEALKEIRQEVKGDKLVLEGDINANINVNVKNQIMQEIDVESIYQLALLKILEKSKIDFNTIANRLMKTTVIISDGKYDRKKIMPVEVKGIEIKSLEQSKMEQAKEAQIIFDKSELKKSAKDLLLERIAQRTKDINNIKDKVEEESIDKADEIKEANRVKKHEKPIVKKSRSKKKKPKLKSQGHKK